MESVRGTIGEGKAKTPEGRRHVIFSDSHGVYLGAFSGLGFWSFVDPAGQDAAPTFTNEEYQSWLKAQDDVSKLPEHRLVEVYPDIKGNYASIRACTNALLPEWDPSEEKEGKGVTGVRERKKPNTRTMRDK